jgi:serine/threonine-protein kinase RsbW/stage II sporulation protein AB (anti-sigma F factor)
MSPDSRSTAEELAATWPAVPASVAGARTAVARFAEAVGATEAALSAVKVAVSEAVTNAVVHAYIEDADPGTVHIAADHDADALRVVVIDEGRGMKPRPDSPGIGLGLPLIAQMTRGFEVHSNETGGTCLEMYFALDLESM